MSECISSLTTQIMSFQRGSRCILLKSTGNTAAFISRRQQISRCCATNYPMRCQVKVTMFGYFIFASRISMPTRFSMRQTDNLAAKFIPQSLNGFSDVGTQIHDVWSFYCCVENIHAHAIFDASNSQLHSQIYSPKSERF